ncbi:MAG: phosphoribosyltransferase [Acidobacteriota bacterium]|nr:phosphoribosyltransferase [Acidobacteriota bacterium]
MARNAKEINECASDGQGAVARGEVQRARALLIQALRTHALVVGEVTLTSGAKAAYYVDAKRALLRPEVFAAVGTLLNDAAERFGASAIGGVPVSAIPVACAGLAAASGQPSPLTKAFIVRSERKAHGLRRLIEGPELVPGERCLVVEDVVTSGGSTVKVIERLLGEGITIAGVVSVLDRLAGGAAAIEAVVGANYEPLVTIDEVYPERPDRG